MTTPTITALTQTDGSAGRTKTDRRPVPNLDEFIQMAEWNAVSAFCVAASGVLAAAWIRKNNFSPGDIPTTANDATQGYDVGSLWGNTGDIGLWICADPKAASAVWVRISRGATLSPDSFATAQVDYAPANFARAEKGFVRLTTTVNSNIESLVVMPDAFRTTLVNIGGFNVTLVHNSGVGGVTAACKFALAGSANRVLSPNTAVDVIYDATTARWHAIG